MILWGFPPQTQVSVTPRGVNSEGGQSASDVAGLPPPVVEAEPAIVPQLDAGEVIITRSCRGPLLYCVGPGKSRGAGKRHKECSITPLCTFQQMFLRCGNRFVMTTACVSRVISLTLPCQSQLRIPCNAIGVLSPVAKGSWEEGLFVPPT